ncbi:GNAT family N-acetyltransferase [Butyrivibrio sp. AC2005]|uniref:GNAT family N-acetyltransferase n=1 Tax=Butyrivibrio sp. AC2005 TaxID=1280672 RepID=UPI00041E9FD8|nr:GNAT family N-acetyltransferase [Butyrivibrio sp. AC2005]
MSLLTRSLLIWTGIIRGGALLLGSEDGTPVGSIAIRKIDDAICEAKRLFIKPEFRGKGYARVMLNTMLDKAKELGVARVALLPFGARVVRVHY